jgi:hypothetical protein
VEHVKDVLAVTFGVERGARDVDAEYDMGLRAYPWVTYTDARGETVFRNTATGAVTSTQPADWAARSTAASHVTVNADASALMLLHPTLSPWERSLKALWGRFAGHILAMNWDEADRDREILRGFISKTRMTDLEALQQRSWLLHWSLFVFANHPRGRDNMVELFTQEQFLNAIQLNCPWLLRYVAAVVLTNKKRQSHVRQRLRAASARARRSVARRARATARKR